MSVDSSAPTQAQLEEGHQTKLRAERYRHGEHERSEMFRLARAQAEKYREAAEAKVVVQAARAAAVVAKLERGC
jgi:hypothetical protein